MMAVTNREGTYAEGYADAMRDARDDRPNIIENLDIINVLYEQIAALLDLIICSNSECVDIDSIKCAAEMSSTMFCEMMQEIKKIEDKV